MLISPPKNYEEEEEEDFSSQHHFSFLAFSKMFGNVFCQRTISLSDFGYILFCEKKKKRPTTTTKISSKYF